MAADDSPHTNLPHTKEEWDRYQASIEAEGNRQFDKGCLIAGIVTLVIILGWFCWMMWISIGGSY